MGFGNHMRVIAASWKNETSRRKAMRGTRRRGPETEFLPEALEIVETPPSPFGRLILWVIILAFIFAVLWAFFGRIDIVATAQGRVIPTGQIQTVEAPERGVVKKIHARNGDRVKAGQVLIELDATLADADAGTVDNELRQANIRAAIARGLLDYGETGRIKFERPEDISDALAEVSQKQLSSRVRAHKDERLLLFDERNRSEASKDGVLREIARIRETLPLMRERMQSFQQLANEGLAPRVEALRLQEELISREKDLEIANGRLREANSAISAADRRL